MELAYVALASGGALAALVYMLTPKLAEGLRRMNITGTDIHKHSRPEVAERGGIIVLIAALLFMAIMFWVTDSQAISYVMLFTAVLGIYGLADDARGFGKYMKIAMLAPIAFVAVYVAGFTGLWIIPAMVFFMGLSNVFNFFAGFNGLETGCSSVALFFLALCCLATGAVQPLMLSAGMLLILLAFFASNKYPSKIFPGNVGTMTIGGFFAAMAVSYGLYSVVIPLMSLYILDMALKAWSSGYAGRNEMTPTKVSRSGLLVARGASMSLARLLIRLGQTDERGLVNRVLKLQAVVGAATLALVMGGLI